MKYKHTNLISKDWRRLAAFYEDVFDCRRIPPERDINEPWLEKGTGVKGAQLSGVHLLLPGYGDNGPTLEILSYGKNEGKPATAANREGYGHIAFEVEDIQAVMSKFIACGGGQVGELTTAGVDGLGTITFVYLSDPEGNIVELQSFD